MFTLVVLVCDMSFIDLDASMDVRHSVCVVRDVLSSYGSVHNPSGRRVHLHPDTSSIKVLADQLGTEGLQSQKHPVRIRVLSYG